MKSADPLQYREGEELRLQLQEFHLVSFSSTWSGVQVLVCGHLELFDSSFPGWEDPEIPA